MCWQCSRGWENYCTRAIELGIAPPGLGAPGAMADLMIVDSPRHLVPIGDLDPVSAVPLTDAGLTPYHAIKRSLGKLRPGGWAVVIGAGGLGHMAIQLLKVLAGDAGGRRRSRRAQARPRRTVGADAMVQLRRRRRRRDPPVIGPEGATVVLDVVGMQATIDLGIAVAGIGADMTIVGIGDPTASARVGFGQQAHEVSAAAIYWGGRHELIELVDLARAGVIEVTTERFSLADGVEAYRRMAEGSLIGRAVVVP